MPCQGYLPYGGLHKSVVLGDCLDLKDTKSLQHVVMGKMRNGGEALDWLNCNPAVYGRSWPKNAWIGSLVNEPNDGRLFRS